MRLYGFGPIVLKLPECPPSGLIILAAIRGSGAVGAVRGGSSAGEEDRQQKHKHACGHGYLLCEGIFAPVCG